MAHQSNQQQYRAAPLPAVRPATKQGAKLRLLLSGPSGSGKTFSALRIARAFGPKILVIDSENGSSEKYADVFIFDVLVMTSFDPRAYMQAIRDHEGAYDALVIDSLSHAWAGPGGLLEIVDDIAARAAAAGGEKDTHSAWRDGGSIQEAFVRSILDCKTNVIGTVRSKQKTVRKKVNGKTTIEKIGLQSVQREGLDYEFDVVGRLDMKSNLFIEKTRCSPLKEKRIAEPGEALGEQLRAWLAAGKPASTGAAKERSPELEAFRPLYAEYLTLVGLETCKRVWNTELGNLTERSPAELVALLPKARAIVAAARPAADPMPWDDAPAPNAAPSNVTPLRPAAAPPPAPATNAVAELDALHAELAEIVGVKRAQTMVGRGALDNVERARQVVARERAAAEQETAAKAPPAPEKPHDPVTGEVLPTVRPIDVLAAGEEAGLGRDELRRVVGGDVKTMNQDQLRGALAAVKAAAAAKGGAK